MAVARGGLVTFGDAVQVAGLAGSIGMRVTFMPGLSRSVPSRVQFGAIRLDDLPRQSTVTSLSTIFKGARSAPGPAGRRSWVGAARGSHADPRRGAAHARHRLASEPGSRGAPGAACRS